MPIKQAATAMFNETSDCSFVEMDPFVIADAPRGTVVSHPVLARSYWVRGTACIYLVRAWRHNGQLVAFCPCAGFGYRKRCAHVAAVAAYLPTAHLCPACNGKGWLHMRTPGPWATREPVPMACCWGTGLKAEWRRSGCLLPPGTYANAYCPHPAAVPVPFGQQVARQRESPAPEMWEPTRRGPSISWMADEDVRRTMFA